MKPVPEDYNSYALRHSVGCNFGFVDGHVEYSKPEDETQVEYGICRPKKFKYVYDNWNFE